MTKIAVIGDLMLDHYIYGRVDRISPEAPVQVVNFQEEKYCLGGAGNVAANLSSMGAEVFLVSPNFYDKEISLFSEGKIRFIVEPSFRIKPIIKQRVVGNHNQQLLRVDYENLFLHSMQTIEFVEKTVKDLLREGFEWAIISDYRKGFVSDTIAEFVVNKFKGNVVVDTKAVDIEPFAGCFALTSNRKELNEILLSEEAFTVCELMDWYSIPFLLETCGSEGLNLYDSRVHSMSEFPVEEIPIYDVTGAGDTVTAAFTFFLANGYSVSEAAEKANLAGQIVVSRKGTALISLDDLMGGSNVRRGSGS